MDCRSVCHLRCASKAPLPEALKEALQHNLVDARDRAKACGLGISWEGDRCNGRIGSGRCKKIVSNEIFLTQYCAKHQCGRSFGQPGDRQVQIALAGRAPEDGDQYEGERDAQQFYHGQGTLRRSDGAVYRGGFLRGHFHGMGRLERRSPGSTITITYVGQCFLGMAQGKGQMKVQLGYKHEEYCYTGEFADGVPHGHGVWRWFYLDGLTMSYEGTVQSPRRFGGILASATDDVRDRRGDFKKYLLDLPMDSITGMGIAIQRGLTMQGRWDNGYMHGHGVAVIDSDGGEWEEYYRGTTALEGKWRRPPKQPPFNYREHGFCHWNFQFGRRLSESGDGAEELRELRRGSFRGDLLHGLGDQNCGGSYSSGRFEDGRLVVSM
jgi:hypothetical protein